MGFKRKGTPEKVIEIVGFKEKDKKEIKCKFCGANLGYLSGGIIKTSKLEIFKDIVNNICCSKCGKNNKI